MSTKTIRIVFPLVITGLLILIAVVDRWLLPDVSLELLYLLPILLSAIVRRWYAFGCSLISILLVKVAVQNEGATWVWSITENYWELFTLFGFYFAAGVLASIVVSMYFQALLLTTRDSQTGLLNQSAFIEHLTSEKNRAERFKHKLTIAYLDLDNFKAINDSHGHVVGDVIIESFSDLLKNSLRDYDISARMGGDEFAILLPETDSENAQLIIQRLQTEFSELQMQELKKGEGKLTNPLPATFSAGVVTYCTPQLTTEEMVHAADQLMYEAKKIGKNKISAKNYPSESGSQQKVSP